MCSGSGRVPFRMPSSVLPVCPQHIASQHTTRPNSELWTAGSHIHCQTAMINQYVPSPRMVNPLLHRSSRLLRSTSRSTLLPTLPLLLMLPVRAKGTNPAKRIKYCQAQRKKKFTSEAAQCMHPGFCIDQASWRAAGRPTSRLSARSILFASTTM